jgi:arsenate reductase (thioredoxin)
VSPAHEPTRAEVAVRVGEETARLAREFKGVFGEETIRRCIEDSERRFRDAKIAIYLPALVTRYAREMLRATASNEGLVKKDRPEVLFVCVHNAGRSQMAAALTRKIAGDRVVVRSAGSAPAAEIHAGVVAAMAEIGLDTSNEFPKPLADEFVKAADVVITMGCGDACPVYPGKKYEDWVVSDPAGRPVEEVRKIREDIRGRVTRLLAELGVAVGPSR